jgi:hypothetical protein
MRTSAARRIIETDAPARLHRLPWCGFHARVAGAAGAIVPLDPAVLGVVTGWRVCFFAGAVPGLCIFALRF